MLYPPLACDSSNHCRDIEGNIIEFIPKNKKQYNSKVYFEAVMDWKGRWYEDGELQDATFLQFTGLLDKNGREIYEGDIVIHENPYSTSVTKEQGEIVFDKGAFWLKNENGNWYFDTSPIVIGNIFENPELLK